MTNETIMEIKSEEDWKTAKPGKYNCWIAKIYNKNNPDKVSYFQGMLASGVTTDIDFSDYYPTEAELEKNLKSRGISLGERENGLVVEPVRKAEYLTYSTIFEYRAKAHVAEPDDAYIGNFIADAAMVKEKADLEEILNASKNDDELDVAIRCCIEHIVEAVKDMQKVDEETLGYFTEDTHSAAFDAEVAISKLKKAGHVRTWELN